MTNKTLFGGAIVFIGGMGVGHAITKHLLAARYQEDVAEVKDFYMAKLAEMGVMPEGFDPTDLVNSIIEVDPTEDFESTEEYFDALKKYSSAATEPVSGHRGKGRPIIRYDKPPLVVTDYGNLEPEPSPDDEDDEDEEEYEAELDYRAEQFAKLKAENQAKGLPYLIESDEFEDNDMYDKQYLWYYSKDRVLCDDNDDIVEDEEGVVGLDYEDLLDIQTHAWVRNDTIMNMYHIKRIDESYHVTIANVAETPMERDFRIKGRRKQLLD